jgi:hypothetical protein
MTRRPRKKTGAREVTSRRGTRRDKRLSGGKATAGGIDFQAAVAACIAIRIATGEPLGWFQDIEDIPIFLDAETGGPGDDLGITLRSGVVLEAQVKKGLSADERLWGALLRLARGLQAETTQYAALIVCPDSSKTIRRELAADLRRIGDGRTDKPGALARTLHKKLASEGIALPWIASRLRIATLHAVTGDIADISAARSQLRSVIRDGTEVTAAWNCLYRDAFQQITDRGRRTSASIAAVLSASRVVLRTDCSMPAAIVARVTNWVLQANTHLTIHGLDDPLDLGAAWMPMKAAVLNERDDQPSDLTKAVEQYHEPAERSDDAIAAQTLGRFIPRCVVQAGPGMGKTTLAAVLARRYATAGQPVLRVSLRLLAARMRQMGQGVLEGSLAIGLDGSGITPAEAILAGLRDWTLICDGLDETAEQQCMICEGLLKIVAAHPSCRVIITTRPVGYQSGLLGKWRHYELLPLDPSAVSGHVQRLIQHAAPSRAESVSKFFEAQLKTNEAARVEARSPLLLTLMVSLAVRNIPFGSSRVELYERLFQTYADGVADRLPLPEGIARETAVRFLDTLGSTLHALPGSFLAATLARCAKSLAADLGIAPLSAHAIADRCLAYWENHGMVERLQVGADSTLTFVHRTFGEYAAARYLVALRGRDRRAALKPHLGHADWNEVLQFAAVLGAAVDILFAALALSEDELSGADILTQCLHAVLRGKPEATATHRQRLMEHVLRRVDGRERGVTLHLGAQLLEIQRRYPESLAGALPDLINSRFPWTRLVGWALIVTSPENRPDAQTVADCLTTLRSWYSKDFMRPYEGVSATVGQFELLSAFAIGATRIIIEQLPREQGDAVLERAFSSDRTWPPDTLEEVSSLVRSAGRPELKISSRPGGMPAMHERVMLSTRAEIALLERILAALPGGRTAVTHDGKLQVELLNLSATLEILCYWTADVGYIQNVATLVQPDDARELILAVVDLIGISRTELIRETCQLLSELNALEGHRERWKRLHERTPRVDIDLDMSSRSSLRIDLTALERGLLHPSTFVTRLATLLTYVRVEDEQRPALLRRVLPYAHEPGLRHAVVLIKALPLPQAVELLLSQLQKTPRPGTHHLFDALAEYASVATNAEERKTGLEAFERGKIEIALRNGLLSDDATIAQSAAKLAAALPDPSQHARLPLLRQAYAFWQQHEEPYPVDGGPIPHSPRDELLRILLRTTRPTLDELLMYAVDPRSDVRHVATPYLLAEITADPNAGDRFLAAIATEQIPPRLLRDALARSVELTDSQRQTVLALLKHESATVRYAALGILNRRYLAPDLIAREARGLTTDPSGLIRDGALALA